MIHSNLIKDIDIQQQIKVNGLRYCTDQSPGISRIRRNKKFIYLDQHGEIVQNELVLKRINALVIPPAWENVWISPWENSHLQATGRDARNRKQYRYHTVWRKLKDEVKYDRMINFGKHLPLIRQKLNQALKMQGLPREKVLATVVYLLQLTMIRVGNDEYAKTNHSYGMTTLRNKHVKIDGSEINFHFKGKSGVEHSITVQDKKLAKIVQRIKDLPGQELFQYVDDSGARHSITSTDVNQYLHEITNEDFTAKDFRTWFGTVLTAMSLYFSEKCENPNDAKKVILNAIQFTSKKLGNTPAICRKCYIHPVVISSYIDGVFSKTIENAIKKNCLANESQDLESILENGLSLGELALLTFLEEQVG
ncbi:MAG: DNA topoisomerase IB [Methylotenera sp.]|uniref:DNA topoisomerase IB n=1 Tax=Methylotenera sp. TaxID=2051956 RepID=UPI002489F198|nr:DNA topoisomerase IB [Methylotenera sp.]MDI1309661.1 DNA topoisomerase IB [Methylotenera sp.]